jgi:hypothetical protein
LRDHFFFDKPQVLFMHIGGEGTVEKLGKGVEAALDAVKAVRQRAPHPRDGFGAPASLSKSVRYRSPPASCAEG